MNTYQNHKARCRWLRKPLVAALAKKDQARSLDWTLPTRLDQEINRCFVGFKTRRAERADCFCQPKPAEFVFNPSLIAPEEMIEHFACPQPNRIFRRQSPQNG